MHGVVARIVPEEGFGFIEADDGREFFFHRNALKATDWGELAPGVPVVFEDTGPQSGDRPREDPRAGNVHLAPEAVPAVDNTVMPLEKTNP